MTARPVPWVQVNCPPVGVIVQVGRLHPLREGEYRPRGHLRVGLRLDVGWFTARSYEVAALVGVCSYQGRVHLKAGKFSLHLMARWRDEAD